MKCTLTCDKDTVHTGDMPYGGKHIVFPLSAPPRFRSWTVNELRDWVRVGVGTLTSYDGETAHYEWTHSEIVMRSWVTA